MISSQKAGKFAPNRSVAMSFRVLSARRFGRLVCILLAATLAIGPSAAAVAQTPRGDSPAMRGPMPSAAQPGGRGATPAAQPATTAPAVRGTPAPAAGQPARAAVAVARIDTTYIAPDADAVIVLRPAQIMASPNAQGLPLEVATAAG
jgi:hypothetical protein